MLNKNIFSLDCETDGLYGKCFAVGVFVLSPEGLIIDKFSGISQIEEVTNDWVKENVLPELSGLKIFSTRKQMRDAFWEFWMKHKESCISLSGQSPAHCTLVIRKSIPCTQST